MAISAGTRLGPYEILSAVGAGGMGEVYRARDTRLDRIVAVKVSNEHFTERFEREARSIAALNHPNICHLYDVGPNYLVMELIEGESPKGPLPEKTVLDYARQIASALDAAHEKGIVHRDLKPANIKVTPDGVVKVLDFGLAKASPTSAVSSEDSPTFTMATTQAGIVLGTAAYMSPEQARGKPVDKRTDIWAFGVVLYELLTGEKPFRGETVTDVLAGVVKEQPDLTHIPPSFAGLIERCLEKDPKRRLRDIADFELLLGGRESSPPPGRSKRTPWIVSALAGIALVILAIGLWRTGSRATDQPLRPLVQLNVDLGQEVSLDETPAISPDGTRIAYVSQGHLFTRRLDQPNPVEMAGSQGAAHPFFSPDGKSIAFLAEGKLRKILVDGGSPVDVASPVISAVGAWGEMGIIAGSLDGLMLVPPEGGAHSQLTTPDRNKEAGHRFPQILPHGKGVLFTVYELGARRDQAKIEVVSLADHHRKIVYSGAFFARYVPTGHLIFIRGDTVFAAPFDLDRLEVRGTPAPVFSHVYSVSGIGPGASDPLDFSISPPMAGAVVYRSGSSSGLGTLETIDAEGKSLAVVSKPDEYLYPRYSPDGQRLALILTSDLYVYDLRVMTR